MTTANYLIKLNPPVYATAAQDYLGIRDPSTGVTYYTEPRSEFPTSVYIALSVTLSLVGLVMPILLVLYRYGRPMPMVRNLGLAANVLTALLAVPIWLPVMATKIGALQFQKLVFKDRPPPTDLATKTDFELAVEHSLQVPSDYSKWTPAQKKQVSALKQVTSNAMSGALTDWYDDPYELSASIRMSGWVLSGVVMIALIALNAQPTHAQCVTTNKGNTMTCSGVSQHSFQIGGIQMTQTPINFFVKTNTGEQWYQEATGLTRTLRCGDTSQAECPVGWLLQDSKPYSTDQHGSTNAMICNGMTVSVGMYVSVGLTTVECPPASTNIPGSNGIMNVCMQSTGTNTIAAYYDTWTAWYNSQEVVDTTRWNFTNLVIEAAPEFPGCTVNINMPPTTQSGSGVAMCQTQSTFYMDGPIGDCPLMFATQAPGTDKGFLRGEYNGTWSMGGSVPQMAISDNMLEFCTTPGTGEESLGTTMLECEGRLKMAPAQCSGGMMPVKDDIYGLFNLTEFGEPLKAVEILNIYLVRNGMQALDTDIEVFMCMGVSVADFSVQMSCPVSNNGQQRMMSSMSANIDPGIQIYGSGVSACGKPIYKATGSYVQVQFGNHPGQFSDASCSCTQTGSFPCDGKWHVMGPALEKTCKCGTQTLDVVYNLSPGTLREINITNNITKRVIIPPVDLPSSSYGLTCSGFFYIACSAVEGIVGAGVNVFHDITRSIVAFIQFLIGCLFYGLQIVALVTIMYIVVTVIAPEIYAKFKAWSAQNNIERQSKLSDQKAKQSLSERSFTNLTRANVL